MSNSLLGEGLVRLVEQRWGLKRRMARLIVACILRSVAADGDRCARALERAEPGSDLACGARTVAARWARAEEMVRDGRIA